MKYVLITVRNDEVSSFEAAEKLLVYDVEEGRPVKSLGRPVTPDLLEDVVEEYDAWVLFTRGITRENREPVEEAGIKIVETRAGSVVDVVKEFFTW